MIEPRQGAGIQAQVDQASAITIHLGISSFCLGRRVWLETFLSLPVSLGLIWKATPLRFSQTLDFQTMQDGAGFFRSGPAVSSYIPTPLLGVIESSKAQREPL